MWRIGVALFVASFVTIFASEAAQPSNPPCDEGTTCASEQGRAMLQKVSARETVDVMEEVAVGTREYEYAGAKFSISADSDVALHGTGLWILTVHDGCTDADVAKMSESMPNGTAAEYSGSPDEGGLCVFMMNGTEDDVKAEIATHSWPSEPEVTADHPIGVIPEINETEGNETEGESLLESDTGAPASWGLDRVDDPSGLDNSYEPAAAYPNEGAGVHVYVLDTGIYIRHRDFGGRAFSAWTAYPYRKECWPNDENCGRDGNGHGTHCAGTIGGSAYGVAKKAKLYGVKVLPDKGGGSYRGIIGGVEHVMIKGHRPAIISMSLGGPGNDWAMKSAVDNAVRRGIPVVVAAGNDGRSSKPDACGYTPAHIPSAITVGATDRPFFSTDRRASYSNYGTCLDLYAPGSSIVSASHRSTWGSATLSGTSMACPHVSGVAALLMGEDPRMAPRAVEATMKANAVKGKVQDAKRGSPNLMLQIGRRSPGGKPPGGKPPGGKPTPPPKKPGFCLWIFCFR